MAAFLSEAEPRKQQLRMAASGHERTKLVNDNDIQRDSYIQSLVMVIAMNGNAKSKLFQ